MSSQLRNEFYAGNYQVVINNSTNPAFLATLDARGKLEAQVLLFRAYLAHSRYNLVIQDIKSRDPDVLIAIQLLAMYLASATRKDDIIVQVQAIAKQITKPDGDLCLILATLLTLDGKYDEALEMTSRCPRDLECVGLTVQLYCFINRPDLAQKEIIQLRGWADDSTLAQMVETWYGMYTSQPAKFEEGYYLFEELLNSHSPTAKLLTSKAVCLLHGGRVQEADQVLLEALNHNPNDASTLANLVVTGLYLDKAQADVGQYLS